VVGSLYLILSFRIDEVWNHYRVFHSVSTDSSQSPDVSEEHHKSAADQVLQWLSKLPDNQIVISVLECTDCCDYKNEVGSEVLNVMKQEVCFLMDVETSCHVTGE